MAYLRSAKVLLIDDKDSVLVLRRSRSHPWASGVEDLPGGAVEADETHAAGVIRELFEETKVVLNEDDLTLADMYKHRIEATGKMIERSLFVARITGKRPDIEVDRREHDQFEWIPIKDLTSLQSKVQEQIDRIVENGFLKTI
jgi:8-oxo-dGTP pyrophosphatase MutT (NUDIX family)